MFITITATEEARTTRFRVAPAQASPRRRENLREDPRRHSPAPMWRALCPETPWTARPPWHGSGLRVVPSVVEPSNHHPQWRAEALLRGTSCT